MTRFLALTLLILAAAGMAHAGQGPAPEIDASSATAAVGLLAGGFAILYSRKARKRK
jgi:peptidoglycan/LPS O-acetylase OafA/YrhL